MIPISPISAASQIVSAYGGSALGSVTGSATGATSAGAVGESDFGGMVGDAANAALSTLRGSEQVAAAGVSGTADVQQVVQALSDAELTMQSVVAVRDKVLGAYNDIMKMTI